MQKKERRSCRKRRKCTHAHTRKGLGQNYTGTRTQNVKDLLTKISGTSDEVTRLVVFGIKEAKLDVLLETVKEAILPGIIIEKTI